MMYKVLNKTWEKHFDKKDEYENTLEALKNETAGIKDMVAIFPYTIVQMSGSHPWDTGSKKIGERYMITLSVMINVSQDYWENKFDKMMS